MIFKGCSSNSHASHEQTCRAHASAPINSRLNLVVRSPTPLWVGSKCLLAFQRVPVTPGTSLHFFAMLLPERPQKSSIQLLPNRLPVFTFSFLLPFSCPSLSPHSSSSSLDSNVHPIPGLIFPCSVYAGKVTWWGNSVQCCTCSKWVHLKVFTTFPLQIQSS